MEAQPAFAGNATGWSIPSANDNPTRCETTAVTWSSISTRWVW
jgi:hypothetical protein